MRQTKPKSYDICEELFKSAVRPVGTDADDYFSVPMDEELVMKTKKIVFETRKGERKVYVPGRFEEMSEEVLDAIIDSPKFREDLAKTDDPKWDRQHWDQTGEYREKLPAGCERIDIPPILTSCKQIPPVVSTRSGPWSRERMEDAFWFIVVAGAALMFAAAVLWYIRTR